MSRFLLKYKSLLDDRINYSKGLPGASRIRRPKGEAETPFAMKSMIVPSGWWRDCGSTVKGMPPRSFGTVPKV